MICFSQQFSIERYAGIHTVSPLPNARHERFAQELAKGKTADEAYEAAGYAQNRGNATRLKANESVLKRVEELQGKAAEKVVITVESLCAELDEARALASSIKQPAAAVAATMGKAKLMGLVVDKQKTEHSGKVTLEELIAGSMAETKPKA